MEYLVILAVLISTVANGMAQFPIPPPVQPSFESSYSTVTVHERSTASLPCTVHNLGPYEVMWWSGTYRAFLTFQETRIFDQRAFRVDRAEADQWNLRIRYVGKKHEANYTCYVTTSPLTFKTVSLRVLDERPTGIQAPSFGVPQDVISVKEGFNVTLPCFVFNLGRHTVSWRSENGTEISNGNRIINMDDRFSMLRASNEEWGLSITDVTADDGGRYRCSINTSPLTWFDVTLNILRRGVFPPNVEATVPRVDVATGETVTLPCRVNNLGNHKVFWTDERSQLIAIGERRIVDDERFSIERPTVNDWNLRITNLSLSLNNYYCHVTNPSTRAARVALYVFNKLTTLKFAIDDAYRCHNTPGLAVSIVQDGETVFKEGFGLADIHKQIPVTHNTLFGVASLSKAFASAVLLKLLSKRDDLGLQTRVVDVLPEFGMSEEWKSDHTTLEDILSHRTGLPANNAIRFDTNLTRKNIAGRIKHLPLTGQWRGSYMYSNLMYGVVTRLAEVLGGGDWEDVVRRELYEPLEMNSSTFATRLNFSSERVAQPYGYYDEEFVAVNTEYSKRWGELCGSGCVVTSAEDAANWMKFHLTNGQGPTGDRVMDKDWVKQLHIPRTSMGNYSLKYSTQPDVPVTTSYSAYALGWRVGTYRGYKMVAHTGSTFGYQALLTLLPDKNLGIFIVMTGYDPSYAFRYALQNYIIDTMIGEKPWLNTTTLCSFPKPFFNPKKTSKAYTFSKTLSHDASAYTGVFNNVPYGDLAIYYNTTDDQLMATYGYGSFKLFQQKGDTFYGKGSGINTVKNCNSMLFRKMEDMRFIEIKVPGFDTKVPPVFVRNGYVNVSKGSPVSVSSALIVQVCILIGLFLYN